jgi:hypothetical protein
MTATFGHLQQHYRQVVNQNLGLSLNTENKKKRKEQNMLSRKLFSGRNLLWVLSLVALLIQLAGVSPGRAATCERTRTMCEFDAQTTVSVSNLNIVCTPPSPITQEIEISGEFVIRAHMVLPPSPVLPPNPIIPPGTIVTLHIDATSISGVGLIDGTLYHGSQGTNQNFVDAQNMMAFKAEFGLVPSQPTETPPSPVCPAQLTFQVQIYETEPGFPAISAILNTLE